MAQSTLKTTQYPTPSFVESCGAILFSPSKTRVCLINHLPSTHYLLPKGRRNINEPRTSAALRELYEETGYRGKLLPVTLATRATVPGEDADVPRVREGLTEPFMFTVRELGKGKGVKIIWWYVAVLDDGGEEGGERGSGEEEFRAEFFESGEAVEKLWFETDREVLRKAVEIVAA